MSTTKGNLIKLSVFIVLMAMFFIPAGVMADYIAIAYQKDAAITSENVTPLMTPVVTTVVPQTTVTVATTKIPTVAVKTTTVAPAPTAPPAGGLPTTTIIIAIVAIIVIVAAAFLVHRWWLHRQNPELFKDLK
jgi:hypothetical protein